MSASLILLARGQSSNRLEQLLAADPGARIWSLNGAHGELDRLQIKPELQFEIHPPRPRTNLIPDVPSILSPFASTILASNLEARFPFAAACELGACFFEITPDFILAYAALLISGRLPDTAIPPGLEPTAFRLPPTAIFLSGIDCADDAHYERSRGGNFWIGVLRGLGVQVIVPPESVYTHGTRRTNRGLADILGPYAYEQPGELVRAAHSSLVARHSSLP